MKKVLNILFGSLQAVLLSLMTGVVAAVAMGYAVVHTRLAGMVVEHALSSVLAEQLGTRVTVEENAEVSWNNQVVLNQLTIYDQQGQPMIYARRAMVAFEIWPLLTNHLVLNTCQLIDFEIHAYRPTKDSPANYQFLVDALAKKNPDRKPMIQQFDLNFIVLRHGLLTYDVQDRPAMADSPIDPYHISIRNLSANVHVHDKELLIKKFHCDEHDNAYRAERIKVALNFAEVLKAPAGEHRLLAIVNGLVVNGSQLNLRADVNGDTDTMEFLVHQLSLPYGHPRLPGIESLQARATLMLSQLSNPLDSLYFSAQLLSLEAETRQYGTLHVTCAAEGTSHDAQLQGSVTSSGGDVTFDTRLRHNTGLDLQLDGHCQVAGLDLSQLTSRSLQLGRTDADVAFGLGRTDKTPWQLSVNGCISQLEFRGHNYRDILLDCQGNRSALQGNVALQDTLGNLSATFDMAREGRSSHLQLEGEIVHLNPNALHLSDVGQLDSVTFTSQLHADVTKEPQVDPTADIRLTDLSLARGERSVQLGDITYNGTTHEGTLLSRIAQMRFGKSVLDGGYALSGRILQSNELLDLLRVPVQMSEAVTFEARIDSLRQLKHASLDLPEIEINRGNFLAARLTANDSAGQVVRPVLALEAHNSEHRLKGELRGRLWGQPQLLQLEPSTFIYNNKEEVHFEGARLLRNEEGDYLICDVGLHGRQQRVTASGVMGHDGGNDFVLGLTSFDLGQIFSNLERSYVHFGGKATGEIVLSSQPETTLSSEGLRIDDFCYIDTLLGDARLDLAYHLSQKRLDATCDLTTPTRTQTHIDCEMQMGETKVLDLRVNPDHLPIGFINNWTGGILQQFSGTATGYVRLFGPTSHLQLEGSPLVDGHFTHNILGAHFHLCDTVRMSHNLMRLEHAYVDDEHGHPLRLSALLHHTDLHSWRYDVDVEMPHAKQGFLVIDRPKKPGSIYWGQIYASGKAHLEGMDSKHRINVNVATTDKSWIFVSPRAQDVDPDQAAYSFLTFRDKDKVEQEEARAASGSAEAVTQALIAEIADVKPSDIEVDIVAQATEQCEVTVQMDPASEDLLSGRGKGILNILYNPQHDLTLTGEYRVSSGTYTMNFNPDVMNKRFQLQNTSYVRFNGVPSEANLKLDAVYSLPSVNMSDLGEQVTSSKLLSRTTAPVDCKMNVSGQLAAPLIEFDLEVKNGNKELDDLVRNTIGTPEMITQQVLYLLIFSKFYPPQDVQSSNQMRAGAELSSLASASISSQLNQLLNRLSDNFTLGTNFKSDRGDFTDMEMDLSLSTRLLNDRLLLYGNVGYRDPANRIGMVGNSSSFIGDFDIEYIVNAARTFRVKVYSHYNERDYSINNALTTQGVGVIYSKDFDTFWQIWQLKNWRRKKSAPVQPANVQPATSEAGTIEGDSVQNCNPNLIF